MVIVIIFTDHPLPSLIEEVKHMEDFPNVVIIPQNQETPEQIIEDYVAIIEYNLERGIPLEEVLYDFFDDVNRWSCREFLIDQAKQSLHELENIHKLEMESIVDDFDEDEEDDEVF